MRTTKVILFVLSVVSFSTLAKDLSEERGSFMNCVSGKVPSTGRPALKCIFLESWEYVHGSNVLHTLASAAEFAQRNVDKECEKHGLVFEPAANPNDRVYGTGGVLNVTVKTEIRPFATLAEVAGEFYCVKPNDLARRTQ